MKVALLTDCYLPRLGGIEVQVHDLAAHLVAAGHEVEVFTATLGAEGERDGTIDVVDGIPVHRLGMKLPWQLPVNPFAFGEIKARLRGGSFDVAHVHMGLVSPFAWDCARAAVGVHLPTTMTWHCMLDGTVLVFRSTGFVAHWARAGVAMNAVSAAAARPLQSVLGDAGRVAVLPNGIDIARWRPRDRVLDRAARSGTVRIVTAMRLATRKRPAAMLEVVAEARRLVPREVAMEVTVLGEGPDRRRLERFIAARGMTDWVHLPGRVSRDELRDRYAEADIYVSPAELESFGIAALEARTAGLPVVGRSSSGIGEFVSDGVNGFLTTSDKGMSRALARLAGDAALRAEMTAYNLDQAPEQDWSNVVERALGEYDRAAAGMP